MALTSSDSQRAHLGLLPALSYKLQEELSVIIFHATTSFKNLHTVVLTPTTFQGDFTGVFRHFAQRSGKPTDVSVQAGNTSPPLRALAVNTSCTDEECAPILSQLTGLSSLSISSPTRAILGALPGWLHRLSDSLAELHLTVRYLPLFYINITSLLGDMLRPRVSPCTLLKRLRFSSYALLYVWLTYMAPSIAYHLIFKYWTFLVDQGKLWLHHSRSPKIPFASLETENSERIVRFIVLTHG